MTFHWLHTITRSTQFILLRFAISVSRTRGKWPDIDECTLSVIHENFHYVPEAALGVRYTGRSRADMVFELTEFIV